MIDISIIIVTFQSADVIEKCLSSIENNTDSLRFEIIIIDNNSRDETSSRIKNYSSNNRKDLTFKIIENSKNIGYAKAVNQGLKIASGEYVLLLNPDVFITDRFCEKAVDFLKENPGAGLVAPQHLSAKDEIIPSCRKFPDHLSLLWEISGLSVLFKKSRRFGRWRMGYFDHNSKREVNQPMGACLMGRKEIIDEIGLMDERFKMFFNDVDWCRRFGEKGYKIFFNPELKVCHLVGHSIMQKRFSMILRSHFEFFLYLQKYYKKWWQRLLNVLAGIILLVTALIRIFAVCVKKASDVKRFYD